MSLGSRGQTVLGVLLRVAASDVFVPWAVNLLNGHTILIKVIEKVGECIFYSKNAGAFRVTPPANFPKSLLGHLTKSRSFYRPQHRDILLDVLKPGDSLFQCIQICLLYTQTSIGKRAVDILLKYFLV